MFKKILIANRGEIACRVIRTAKAMGIKTVAVYSEADADALHVREADEAVAIGPPPAAQSYLVIDNILAAVAATGAEAVHPGYGFLSENPAFAEALDKAGIVFIGPPPAALAAMGDKIESKRLAQAAGVSTVPGHLGVVPDAKTAVRIARDIGYPVMIKASAGGGGKGMRIARSDAEVRDGFRAAASEAKSSFADDRVFVEKFIERPRHIEIQVLADGHGNIVYLGERECSVQRRHQKVLEEAPSPFIDAKTRAAMGAQAVALAGAVGYRSAGTVEFIVNANKNFYFLEMNTRLQVEHPVTEMVVGLDLVEQMIRVAAGERLGFGQAEVKISGWAIEARVYAEDPLRGFLPAIGRLVRYRPPGARPPALGARIRVDGGVFEGAEIGVHYDPMIAKLIAHGVDRAQAIAAMREALDAFYIRGVGNNLGFLAAVMAHPRFAAGDLSTDFIAEAFPGGFAGGELTAERADLLVAVAAVVHHQIQAREAALGGGGAAAPADWVVLLDGARRPVRVTPTAAGFAVADGTATRALTSDWRLGDPVFEGVVDGRPVAVQIDRQGVGYVLSGAGVRAALRVLRPRAAELAARMLVKPPPDTSRFLLSPMPGLLVSLAVGPGEEVKAGQELAVVEAMKMENLLRAERDGRVAALRANPGDSLAADQAILEFE